MSLDHFFSQPLGLFFFSCLCPGGPLEEENEVFGRDRIPLLGALRVQTLVGPLSPEKQKIKNKK